MPEVITVGSHYYSIWSTAYGNIRRINQFLRDMEKYSTFDEESEKIWEAQARFFRAYVYFQLAKRHPGVILYDELPTDGQRDRATEEETWDFIEHAGIIHTDFEKGFIRAEVIKYDDYVALGGENGVKEAGKLSVEGKEYVVQDGDIMHFRFNV